MGALLVDGFLFVVSVWMCSTLAIARRIRKRGRRERATVVRVERMIPVGWRRLFSRRNGVYDCDYLLTLSVGGKLLRGVSCRSTMRILDGRRIPRYQEGDGIEVLVAPPYRKTVLVVGARNEGSAPALAVWGFCAAATFCLFFYMLAGR